eukprot:Gb_27726 [translate_table: standard]
MRDRGKTVEIEAWEAFETRCRRHPSQISTGICPLCLKERLSRLFCPDCGEQRPSSCSCSEASTSSSSGDCLKKNNDGSVEVGSVGRISFLIESDRPDLDPSKPDAILFLRRSKSAVPATRRTVLESKPYTPKSPAKKRSFWSFLYFKKRKNPGEREAESTHNPKMDSVRVEEKLVKSKSVAVGRRSFSGYGYLWDKSPSTQAFCAPVRALEETDVKGLNGIVCEVSQPPNNSRSRGWSWSFTSPIRAFKHSKVPKETNDRPPSPLTEMCRG